jgi:chromosome segregation ATPase
MTAFKPRFAMSLGLCCTLAVNLAAQEPRPDRHRDASDTKARAAAEQAERRALDLELAEARAEAETRELEVALSELATEVAEIEIEKLSFRLQGIENPAFSPEQKFVHLEREQARRRARMQQIETEINRVALRFARQRLESLNIRRTRVDEQATPRHGENRAVELRIEYTDDAAPPVIRGPKAEVDRVRELLERTGQVELIERR